MRHLTPKSSLAALTLARMLKEPTIDSTASESDNSEESNND